MIGFRLISHTMLMGFLCLTVHIPMNMLICERVFIRIGIRTLTGWSAMAKTQEEADRLMHELKQRPMAPA